MKYLLDTDHLSIIQRQTGQDYVNLSTRIAQYPLSDFAISIVTFHEQLLGSHTYISRARNDSEVIKGYEMMVRLINDFKVLPLVSFDADAATALSQLQAQRIQLARMDSRIAAMSATGYAYALSRKLVLLTRNHRDFSKITGLLIEDWTL